MLFSVKIIAQAGNSMLNMCDPELLVKIISDGKVKMKITKYYYHDQLVEQYEADQLRKKSVSINLV